MEFLLIALLAGSVLVTFMYVASTFLNAIAGGSWFWRFLMTLLFIYLDLVILDALNWI